jgi:hypothetical protein
LIGEGGGREEEEEERVFEEGVVRLSVFPFSAFFLSILSLSILSISNHVLVELSNWWKEWSNRISCRYPKHKCLRMMD